jgi:hypothetical protein
MKSPWKRATETRSVLQERRTAEKPGARAQINSGRTWSSLRDVRMDSPIGRLLIDNKDTEGESYTIKRSDFKAMKRDANRTPPGCHPMLQIDIQDLRLMLFEEALWDEIVNYILFLEEKAGEG